MNILKVFMSVGAIKGLAAFLQICFIFLVSSKSSTEGASFYMWGLSAMMIFSTVIKFGADNYIISSFGESSIENSKNVSICYISISVLWLFLSVPIYFVFRYKLGVLSSILFLVSVYLFSVITFSSFVKQGERKFRYAAFLLNGQFYLFMSLFVYLFFFFFGELNIVNLLFLTTVSLILISLGNVLPIFFNYYVITRLDFFSFVKKSRFFFVTSVMSILMNWLPPFYAIYIIQDGNSISDIVTAQRVAIGVSFTLTIVNSFLGPLISKAIVQGDIKSALTLYKKAICILFFTSTPIMALCWFYLNEVSDLFSIENNKILLILLFAQYINSICGPVGVFLNMSGNSKYVTISSAFSLLLGFVLMNLLGEDYSSYGIAISVASMVLISNFISLYWMYKIFYVKNSSHC